MQLKPAIFLDRDGVINRLIAERGERETPVNAGELQLLPQVPEALARLKRAGFLLIVVTNQPNFAKGKCSWDDQLAIENRLVELLGEAAKLDRVYTCLHHPDPGQVVNQEYLADCHCRKPRPGLIRQALAENPIDLEKSWLIGDAETDVEAGSRVGLPPERLIRIGESSRFTMNVAADLWSAAMYLSAR